MKQHPAGQAMMVYGTGQDDVDSRESAPEQTPQMADVLARIADLDGQLRTLRGRRARLRRLGTLAVAVGLVGALTGVAHAAIGGGGVITGCSTTAAVQGQHVLTLIDPAAGTKCASTQTTLTWNQTGPQGPQGPKGDTGPQGLKGDTGAQGLPGLKGDTGAQGLPGLGATTAAEPAGANCATGGTKITDGSGNVSYVCTGPQGAQGPQGATGPQGPAGAAGVSGYNIQTFDWSVPDLASRHGTIYCQGGTKALGGGVQDLSQYDGIDVNQSYPLSDGSGWFVNVYNNGLYAETENIREYVVCATVS